MSPIGGFGLPWLDDILNFCGPPDNRLLARIRELRVAGMNFQDAKDQAKREAA